MRWKYEGRSAIYLQVSFLALSMAGSFFFLGLFAMGMLGTGAPTDRYFLGACLAAFSAVFFSWRFRVYASWMLDCMEGQESPEPRFLGIF